MRVCVRVCACVRVCVRSHVVNVLVQFSVAANFLLKMSYYLSTLSILSVIIFR